jgi:steroid 5-alpha reductase family enzyme
MDYYLYGLGLLVMLGLALVTWVSSLFIRDVSIVDSVWALFFVSGAAVFSVHQAELSARALCAGILLVIWASRLSAYLTWRNWGQPEDHRYQVIRANNSPFFSLKSFYLIFALQAILAWIVSLPIFAILTKPAPWSTLDTLGCLIWGIGFFWETIADFQLTRFKANPAHKGKVLNTGLWRLSRHPNYFGEFCVWWGFYVMALSTGAWWSIIGPVLMSLLLLRVSGVTLLEKDIHHRRPDYQTYVKTTNAFFPGRPRLNVVEGESNAK